MNDPLRLAAFRDPGNLAVFHSVAHRHEIWREDPFDVESIHAEARAVFRRLVDRATTPPGLPSGRLLLLRGEAGSGKTHLMRAFRSAVHEEGLGYVGYMQMTSSVPDYGRYVLANLVDSLDHPYWATTGAASGWARLSAAVAGDTGCVRPDERDRLRSEESGPDLARLVGDLSGRIVDRRLADDTGVDLDLVRALLYLQHERPSVRRCVLKYLRCEDLADYDRALLGGLVPRTAEHAPQELVERLGRLVWRLEGRSLVVCLDQLEDLFEDDEKGRRLFLRAMQTICELYDRIPSSVFVVGCLEDHYHRVRSAMANSMIDRIEQDPEPIDINLQLSEEDISLVIARRLAALWEAAGLPAPADDPLFPFRVEDLAALQGMRLRDILDACRTAQERCMRTGEPPRLVPPESTGKAAGPAAAEAAPTAAAVPVVDVEREWNDWRVTASASVPEDDDDLAELLAWGLAACSPELDGEGGVAARTGADGVDVSRGGDGDGAGDGGCRRLLVAICNRRAQGGGLARQIDALRGAAAGRTPVAVRSTAYPSNPRTKIAKQLGEFVTSGGRRVVVEDSEWRAIALLRSFLARDGLPDALDGWRAAERPLTRLHAFREILGLDEEDPPLAPAEPEPEPESTASDAPPDPRPTSTDRDVSDARELPTEPPGLVIGSTGGETPGPFVSISRRQLKRHAGLLGGSGSGKTTLALRLIEQLLLRDVPAVLIDRKGDLVSYAMQLAWQRPLEQPREEEERQRLRDRVRVRLFTPGEPRGQPLSISIVPEGTARLADNDREQVCRHAAGALGSMLGYKAESRRDRTLLAILAQAIDVQVQIARDGRVELDDLADLADRAAPELTQAIGRLDRRHLARLTEDLETLRLRAGELLDPRGARLDLETLLRPVEGPDGPRVPLNIISTHFLGDNDRVLFWVAQFLLEASRHAVKHPSPMLQSVLFFDEADLYLPAQGKPPTKELMEHGLKRFRSAGIGILLATQSPGDLEYRCRDNISTWFVGKVKEKTALQKIQPMVSECSGEAMRAIPRQEVGEFYYLFERRATAFRALRSLVDAQQLAEDEILRAARESALR